MRLIVRIYKVYRLFVDGIAVVLNAVMYRNATGPMVTEINPVTARHVIKLPNNTEHVNPVTAQLVIKLPILTLNMLMQKFSRFAREFQA